MPLADRRSMHHYRQWCAYLRSCQIDPRKYGYARNQWNLYWDGVRDHRLADAAIWLIDKFGYPKFSNPTVSRH